MALCIIIFLVMARKPGLALFVALFTGHLLAALVCFVFYVASSFEPKEES